MLNLYIKFRCWQNFVSEKYVKNWIFIMILRDLYLGPRKKYLCFCRSWWRQKIATRRLENIFFFTTCKIIFSCFNACLTFKNNCFLLIVFTTESWLYKKWQTWLWPGQDKKSFTRVLRQKQMYTFFTFFFTSSK